jgi:phosphopantothenoylcysteine decarboxylase/phosphopantothenate--cysteine ligase
MDLKGKNVLLGVTSGVALFKACVLIGPLKHMGANIKVIMTKNATELITPRYFAELTGNPVAVEMFAPIEQHEVQHISLATWADIVLIVPATANIISKISNGIADDMLSTTIMAIPAGKPIVFAPAMNTHMWENPITQNNIAKLKEYGYLFVDPIVGMLACGVEGIGKLEDPKKRLTFITNL